MHLVRVLVPLLLGPRSSLLTAPLPAPHLHNAFVVWLTQTAGAGATPEEAKQPGHRADTAPRKSHSTPSDKDEGAREADKEALPRNASCNRRTQQRSLMRNLESAHKA